MASHTTAPPTDRWQKAVLLSFNFLLLSIPFFFTWINEELFEFNKMLVVYAMTVVIAGLWCGRMLYYKQAIFRKTIFDIPIGMFFLSQLVSTLFSIDLHTSIFGYYTRFNGGLLSTIAYITLFYAFVSNLNRAHLRSIFLTVVGTGAVVSLLAIPEHFGHAFTCLLINSDQHAKELGWSVFSPAQIREFYNVECWIQDVKNRVFATFGQPNWLAAYAITLIPLAAVLSSEKKRRLAERVLFGVTAFALFATLLFTKSRSGLLGFGVGMGVFTLGLAAAWVERKLILKDARSTVKDISVVIGGSIFLGCGLLALYFGTTFTPSLAQLQHRPVVTMKSGETAAGDSPVAAPVVNRLEEGGTDSGEIRRIVWKGAFKVWQRYPLFGSGVETFAYSYYKDRPVEHNLVSEWDFLYNKAHNEFLNFLATTGLFGFIAYCLMLGSFIGFPLKSFLTNKNPFTAVPMQSLAIAAGLIALSISNLLGFSTVVVSVLLFILPAISVVSQDTFSAVELRQSKDDSTDTYSGGQVAGFSLVFFSCVLLLLFFWNQWQADHFFATGKRYSQGGMIGNALPLLEKAVQLSPNESYFYDELSYAYAKGSLSLVTSGEATAGAQMANQALTATDKLIDLNSVNPNYYKTKTRTLLLLAQLNPKFLFQARDTLLKAVELAPTDPKLFFNLGVVESSLELHAAAIQHLEKAVELKPDYDAPRLSLAAEYEQAAQLEKAKEQYLNVLSRSPNDPKTLEKLKNLDQQIATASAAKAPVKTKK